MLKKECKIKTTKFTLKNICNKVKEVFDYHFPFY